MDMSGFSEFAGRMKMSGKKKMGCKSRAPKSVRPKRKAGVKPQSLKSLLRSLKA